MMERNLSMQKAVEQKFMQRFVDMGCQVVSYMKYRNYFMG